MSGYVHPTSVHILDSWGGYPPHFQLTGMCETPREPQWEAQGIHSLHRGLIGIMYAAKRRSRSCREAVHLSRAIRARVGLDRLARPR